MTGRASSDDDLPHDRHDPRARHLPSWLSSARRVDKRRRHGVLVDTNNTGTFPPALAGRRAISGMRTSCARVYTGTPSSRGVVHIEDLPLDMPRSELPRPSFELLAGVCWAVRVPWYGQDERGVFPGKCAVGESEPSCGSRDRTRARARRGGSRQRAEAAAKSSPSRNRRPCGIAALGGLGRFLDIVFCACICSDLLAMMMAVFLFFYKYCTCSTAGIRPLCTSSPSYSLTTCTPRRTRSPRVHVLVRDTYLEIPSTRASCSPCAL